MRRSRIAGIAALVVAAFCLPALAQANDDYLGVVKWIQEPDMERGRDLQSQYDITDNEPDVIKADDWICLDGWAITDIHWWGSFYANQAFEFDQFLINIYENDPGELFGPQDDLPGVRVWGGAENPFPVSSLTITFAGVDSAGENVYRYDLQLEEADWFYQVLGTKYWLSIIADTPEANNLIWGWHSGFQPQLDGLTTAVNGKVLYPDATGLGNPDQWAWITEHPDQMAFVLTSIPEPGTIALFGLGVAGLLALRRRKR
jgi:hypothetical protein